MNHLALAVLLAGMLGAAHGADPSFQELDFSGPGTVESVRPIPIAAPLQDVFEHAVRPQTADELVIRIDNGRAVVLHQDEGRYFFPGQRVRLVSSTRGLRVEYQ